MTSQDFEDHIDTYKRFVIGIRYFILAHFMIATLAVFYFWLPGGWAAGFVAAAIVFAIGVYFIRRAARSIPEQ